MSPEQSNVATVVVPIGLGGKTTPYVPDPAPTLVVEVSGVTDPTQGADLIEVAERVAAEIIADAEAEAASTRASMVAEATAAAEQTAADARAEAERITNQANADATALLDRTEAVVERRGAELDEREQALSDREEDLARRETELADHRDDLSRRESELAEGLERIEHARAELEDRSHALDERDRRLTDRFSDADREAAEAARLVDAARNEADAIVLEARLRAEELAAASAAFAPPAAGSDAGSHEDADRAEMLAELENVHRIEVDVLRAREDELLGRIAELERRLDNEVSRPVEQPEERPDSTARPVPGRHREQRPIEPVAEPVSSDETASSTRSHDPAPVASHQPLTEQLTASAFRTQPRRKRR